MKNNEPGLQATAARTLDLIQRIRKGLDELNENRLAPIAAMLDTLNDVKSEKAKPN